MKIIVSNDHAGTVLKNGIIDYLNQNNHEVINIGTNNLDSVDYPDFAYNVAMRFKKEVIDLESKTIETQKNQNYNGRVWWAKVARSQSPRKIKYL